MKSNKHVVAVSATLIATLEASIGTSIEELVPCDPELMVHDRATMKKIRHSNREIRRAVFCRGCANL
jgi:hypothetical protein